MPLTNDTPLSIYLHIPFCTTKCTYCAFNTYAHLDHLIPQFVAALCHEIEVVAQGNPYPSVGTVYFGGGTPSLLTPDQFSALLTAIKRCFTLLPDAEISIEANPNDLSTEYLQQLHLLGINRLSIGMQSANPGELKLFDRRHDFEQVVRAVESARAAGFDNINLDLMYGVPHQTIENWENSVRQAIRLQPEHLSLYALGLEEGTSMKAWVDTGRLPTPDDDLAADMYELATRLLDEAGYVQYEISNWAKPGYACRHNLQYWRNWPYIGLGPGAHGYAAGFRYSVILSPQRYIKQMQPGSADEPFPRTPALAEGVIVDWENEVAETLIMGLRLLEEGIRRDTFHQRFGVDVVDLHRITLEKYTGYGLLSIEPEVVRITQQGRLLSNMIFRELI